MRKRPVARGQVETVVRMPGWLHDAVKAKAAAEGQTVAEVMRNALTLYTVT